MTSLTGLLQPLEFLTFDNFFRWRFPENVDPRIVIVTVSESDIIKLKQWPLSDEKLVKLINNIKKHEPRVIGLNIFRDFPIEPGYQKLISLFKSTPNLIGIEKLIGQPISGPPILSENQQVGFVDMVLDEDGTIRRDLVTMTVQKNLNKLSFPMLLSLKYLEKEEITPQLTGEYSQDIIIGKARLTPLSKDAGSYIGIDNAGYQILLNFRGIENSFDQVSILDVLNNKIPDNLWRDRVVLIGVTAESINKSLFTPYSSSQPTSGVIIQANSVSQILSAALDNRPLLRVFSDFLEWLWLVLWSLIAAITIKHLIRQDFLNYSSILKWGAIAILNLIIGMSLIVSNYLLFLLGWWIPTISPLLGIAGASIIVIIYQWKYLATIDSLTQIPNRFYFNQFLQTTWKLTLFHRRNLSIILCDVDHFKRYNDTYGHQEGDNCLQKVAQAINKGVRRTDFVARYGGEEFVVVLPNTDTEQAIQIAQRMLAKVKALNIAHETSLTANHVTISCGIASLKLPKDKFYDDLILRADQALYEAKRKGRNRVVVYDYMANVS
ncbi:adenylate cyclase [Aphanothece sacrum FPU3]|nr:adenylate cyclase [Aphanothece sacrum FPU3]